MNKLSVDQPIRVISALMEGCIVNSTVRKTGVSKPSILKLLVDLGTTCEEYHDKQVRGVTSKCVEVDKIRAFMHFKQKN